MELVDWFFCMGWVGLGVNAQAAFLRCS